MATIMDLYNCVYWYRRDKDEWYKAVCAPAYLGGHSNLKDLRQSIERMGYACVYGCTEIGPPEGPPLTGAAR